MFRGLWRLTWLEARIFVREPLGLIGTVGAPVLIFVLLGRLFTRRPVGAPVTLPRFVTIDLPVFAALLIATSAVLSLVTIIAIYREGGILKRLRATPLRSHTILLAHVMVKLAFTVLTLVAMVLAGRRFAPLGAGVSLLSFAVALVFTTVCILSLGFLIASLVPTARFAQPIGTLVLYPMLGLSGLFMPIDAMHPALRAFARVQPYTHAVSLLRGVASGDGWYAHAGDVTALCLVFLACALVSARVFRWE